MSKLIKILFFILTYVNTCECQIIYSNGKKGVRYGNTREVIYLNDFRKDSLSDGRILDNKIKILDGISAGFIYFNKNFKFSIKDSSYSISLHLPYFEKDFEINESIMNNFNIYSIYVNNIYIKNSIFCKESMINSVFKEVFQFENTEYRHDISCVSYGTRFNIYNSKFHRQSSFTFRKYSISHFLDNIFDENASIYSFGDGYNMEFSRNTFNSEVVFDDTQLPLYMNFKNNKFKTLDYKINLTNCKVDSIQSKYYNKNPLGRCLITLSPDNASNVIIDSKLFWIEYDSLLRYDEMLNVYEKVINTCRELNMEESIEGFDIQYQIFKIRHKYGIFGEPIVQFQDYWWGFGYKRSNILQNIVWAFLASFVIFFIGYKNVFRAYSPNSDHDTETVIKECADSVLERFKVVFFYTAMVFFSWKVEHARVDYRRYPWIALMIYTIYVIGLIHLAYLAAFVLAK